MTRQSRIDAPDALHHIIARGIGRRNIFNDDQDREFVDKGVSVGKRPDLVGGGLVRSMGGWAAVEALRKAKDYMKGDERILGDSYFAEQVLQTLNNESVP